MILKVFDVAHGSANFLISPTGKTELTDLGARAEWSPLQHIYANYIAAGSVIDRIVLTHHHGDHLSDVDNLTPGRMPKVVLRRPLNGRYEQGCRESNSSQGQRRASRFDGLFKSFTHDPAPEEISDTAWGVSIWRRWLTVEQADAATKTWNSMANCASYLTLYDHNGTRFLLCGDMETEGMALLLDKNPRFTAALSGVDVLVAPHHGHTSGFSTVLMRAIGRPDVVVASIMSGDEHVDGRYSSEEWVRGILWSDGSTRRLLTTRSSGALTVESKGSGGFHVTSHKR